MESFLFTIAFILHCWLLCLLCCLTYNIYIQYINQFDNAITFKHQSILLFWYLEDFLEKDKTGIPHEWSKLALIKWSVIYSLIPWVNSVIQEAPPWLAPSGELLQIWPVQIAQSCHLRLLQRSFLSSVAASNWWLENLGSW